MRKKILKKIAFFVLYFITIYICLGIVVFGLYYPGKWFKKKVLENTCKTDCVQLGFDRGEFIKTTCYCYSPEERSIIWRFINNFIYMMD